MFFLSVFFACALVTSFLLFFIEIVEADSYVVKSPPKQVRLYFFDENNCSLEGYLFVDNKLVGRTEKGFFNLSYEYYEKHFKGSREISLFGKLGECYEEELFFDKYWKSFEIEEEYFSGSSLFNFKASLNPHNPSRRELIGFVKPSDVSRELNKIKLSGVDNLEDLSSINNYLNERIEYVDDWEFNDAENYWQSPPETLILGRGDCEDYSTLLLSLFLSYNSSLNCYNLIFPSHVTTMCQVGNYYVYYDQEKTELRKRITGVNVETKPKLRALKREYLEHYGIEGDERVYYAFNENSFIEFLTDEDFISWQSSLPTKSSGTIFNRLENELRGINVTYAVPQEMIVELPSLQSELPSLRGFVEEYFAVLIILGSLALLLILILVIFIARN